MKPKLLVIELWALGDLMIAAPFLRAASETYSLTLLAKPYARELTARFWPQATVVPFVAPWTSFRHKYHLWTWPWNEFRRIMRLRDERFSLGASGRCDPRDHVLLRLIRPVRRLGFGRLGSGVLLTERLPRPGPLAHRYEYWHRLGRALGLTLPDREWAGVMPASRKDLILIHTGAGQPVRVWPLDRYQSVIRQLRQAGYRVQVACDAEQRGWWLKAQECQVITPRNLEELMGVISQVGAFIGNDSGPGHLAAALGVPTFTIFGPQLPEWFSPRHPQSEWVHGRPCPHKPCFDSCRFAVPHCLHDLAENEVWERVKKFAARHAVAVLSKTIQP